MEKELEEVRVDVTTNTERLVCQFSGYPRAQIVPQVHSPGDAGSTLLTHTRRVS